MVKSVDEVVERYTRNSLRAYFEGKKNINWALGVVRESGVLTKTGLLQRIVDRLAPDYSHLPRFEEDIEQFKKLGWL